MESFNTVSLIYDEASLTYGEWKRFTPGDLLYRVDRSPQELKRWSFTPDTEQTVMAEAKAELAKHVCSYSAEGNTFHVEEYGLEVFHADEDGEFLFGSDFYFAKAEYSGFASDEEEDDED